MKRRRTNLPVVVIVLLVCATRTSGDQETTLPTDTTSTTRDTGLTSTQAYNSYGTRFNSPLKPLSQENETSELQPTEDQAFEAFAKEQPTGTTEKETFEHQLTENKVFEASERENPTETVENSPEETITLPRTVVTVVLILLLSTSVLHCVVVIHYCIRIWSCCTEEAEDDTDYSLISAFGLGDTSNRSSLNNGSVVLRKKSKKNKKTTQQRGAILESRSTYQDSSYRCNSDFADGFLNLDRAINQGRHSRRVSCLEKQLSERQNQNRNITKCPDNETTAAGKTSAILPRIQVEYQDEKATSGSARGAGSTSSVPESLEKSPEGASTKDYAMSPKHQKDQKNLTFADVHTKHFITEDNYSLRSIQWHVVDTENEPPIEEIVPVVYKMIKEESGTFLGLRECNTEKQHLKDSVEELARKPIMALEPLGLTESNTTKQHLKGSVEELARVETRKPVMALEQDPVTTEINAPKRAVSAVYLKQPTGIQTIHKQQQQQPQATEVRRFSSFEPRGREIYQSPRQDSVPIGAKRHYFLHFGGPETSV
ncbi:uncharacterized protein [Macrobrachium rosenbergii]|uniref:uncharacterized protein n=1 Tax=Macrobrachium rosenbergii TaxID=79674 RepID=UPI0034D3CB69